MQLVSLPDPSVRPLRGTLSTPDSHVTRRVARLTAAFSAYECSGTLSDGTDIAGLPVLLEEALTLLRETSRRDECLPLAAVIFRLGWKRLVNAPAWIADYLAAAITAARLNPAIDETELIEPMLTLALDPRFADHEQQAVCLINRAYRRTVERPATRTRTGRQADLRIAHSAREYRSPLTP